MNKKYLLLLFAGLMSFKSFSQTVKDNINKQAKDKNTMDRSAKADVLIQSKTISSSSKTMKIKVETSTDLQKIKLKKHKYKKKYKPSSK